VQYISDTVLDKDTPCFFQMHKKTLEERILILQKQAAHASISIQEILYTLSGKGRPVILILLSLPFCQPIQIPGLSTPFGLVIAFIGLRSAFGRHIWLPKQFLAKTISTPILKKLTRKALYLISKMKPWIHPRMDWICNSPSMQIVNGLTIATLGVFLALPLPIPLTNLAAAWSILLITLGTLEDDGLFVSAGYATFLLTVAFFLILISPIKQYFESS
jgi:hypothetical protein